MIPTDYRFPDLNTAQGALPAVAKRPLLERLDSSHDFVLKLDNSTLSYLQTCPRSAEYYAIHRRQRPDRAPLIFGGAMHAALEVIYRDGYDAYAKAHKAMLDYFAAHPYNTAGEWRTPAYCIEAFNKYVSDYSIMDTITPLSPSWVEKAFALNIGHFAINSTLPFTYAQLTDEDSDEPMHIDTLHLQWSGKIDIVHRDEDGHLFVVDHKTTSIGGTTFFEDFKLAQQTHGYMWAAQEILGEPFAGFILNALIIRKPTKTGVGMEFTREQHYYTQESIDEWKSDTLTTIETFIHYMLNGYYPKATAWCMGKYGKCPYFDVCTLPANQRALMLSTDQYSNVTWSPLEKGAG